MTAVDFFGIGLLIEQITAKKNYASSMQSHKMGACRMFNVLHKYMADNYYPDLRNEVDGNYAVEQIPVIIFQDVALEGTGDYEQRCGGLFTIGAHKGDENWFGFLNDLIKDIALRLEGTDHIKGAGFNYPWMVNGVKTMTYNHDKEGLCIITGSDASAWSDVLEVSYCGAADTEEGIEAYLIEKFKPTYDLAYNNNPLLVGTTMTIDEINADKSTFQRLRRTDGRPYSYCEFWIDGEYDVYYLNQERNQYEKNGLNVYDVLSAEDKALVDAATTLDEKNAIFIAHRVATFKASAESVICVNDTLFMIVFCLMIVASDNFEKNMYPYIMDTLLRFFQDDLDSIFSTDNQAQDTKSYSAELHDFTDDTQSAYVFKGEDNALLQLIEMAYSDRFIQMGKDMLQSMYNLSTTGTKTLDKLNGFYDDLFFNQAQNYFPISAYNNDTEIAYEEAWNDKAYVASVDIHPLAQALGNHYTTEKRFVNLRNIYMMSKFGFGGFVSYEDSSLGIISVRTQDPVGFTLTPAIDMYPTILGGQAQISKSPNRVKAGQSVTLGAVGGGNTNVYIVAANYLTDIGDLKDLPIDPSSVVALNISAKRLRWLKVGDKDASAVTSYLGGLNIQKCDCLETIDARNLVSLQGSVDLSKCPRLYSALFSGTSVVNVNIPQGSKIEALSLPNTITTLSLVKLQNLTLENFDYGTLENLSYLRVEGNKYLDGIGMLRAAYTNSPNLTNIRVLGISGEGTSEDVDMLAALITSVDENGNRKYGGIDAEGNTTDMPVLEGTLTITTPVYQDSLDIVNEYFPNMLIVIDIYLRFEDEEVARICAETWGDGTGITREQAAAVTSLNGKFNGNSTIKHFKELRHFTGVTQLNGSEFYNCTALESIDLANIKRIEHPNSNTWGAFQNCSALASVGDVSNLEHLGYSTFQATTSLVVEMVCPNLTTMFSDMTFYKSGIKKFSAPKLVGFEYYKTTSGGTFYQCPNLEELDLPLLESILPENPNSGFAEGCTALSIVNIPNVTIFGGRAFYDCPLANIQINPNTTRINFSAFYNTLTDGVVNLPLLEYLNRGFTMTKITKVENLGFITHLYGEYWYDYNRTFSSCTELKIAKLPSTLTTIGARDFYGCTKLHSVVCYAVTPPTLSVASGKDAFDGCTALSAIYVPDESLEAYKTDTQWLNYAAKILPLSEYVEE